MSIEINNLTKAYGHLVVYEDFSLNIPEQTITCLLGPSGVGKTTLLNMISGLAKPDHGIIQGVEGQKFSYLFQEHRLLPWKTVWDNVEFVLKDRYPKQERIEVVNRCLRMVNLTEFKHYYPDKLSGGMKQRAAIARAFAYPSDILLMDEPFKALDVQLKLAVMNDFITLWQNDRRTVIYVTHDLQEAVYLGDIIYVLSSLPAKIRKKVLVDVPREQRKLGDSKLTTVEEKIYQLMVDR